MSVDNSVDDEVYVHIPPQLTPRTDEDRGGQEVVSPVSLVAIADLRPMSLGERIRRYSRSPVFQEDLEALLTTEIEAEVHELLDADENPMSKYEERAEDLRSRIRDRKNQEKEDAKNAAKEREKALKEEFRARMKELQEEGRHVPPQA